MKKRCTKCGLEKEASEFSLDKRSKSGLQSPCKLCVREYRKQNKKILNANRREEYRTNPEKFKKQNKESYKRNKPKRLETIRKYYKVHREEILDYHKVYAEEHKEEIKQYKKGHYEQYKDIYIEKAVKWGNQNPEKVKEIKQKKANTIPQYFEVDGLLTITEKPISDENGLLKVVCAYCDRYFHPRYSAVKSRIRCINGETGGELRLYCSDNCKKACSIYGQISYPKGFRPATSREVQPELRIMCLKRDNYECQRCGKSIDEAPLHCHHYTGTVQNPIESADVDNTVIVCKKCHKWVHTQEGCKYFDLRCGKVEKSK